MTGKVAGIVVLAVGLALAAHSVMAARTTDPLGIAVSPQTLLLGTVQSGKVYVHTSIPISIVNCSTLALNGVPVKSIGVDALGQVVAGFDEAAIEAIVAPPSATLTLTGEYKDGAPFAGSDSVRVTE